MKPERITKGTEISTIEGKIVATSYNGSIVYFDEYTLNEEGEYEYERERRLTLCEVGKVMKELDGMNHNVIWEE